VKVYKRVFLIWCLTACGAIAQSSGQEKEKTVDERPSSAADKTIAKLSQLIGGTWVNTNPKFVVEFRYHWAFDKKAIRGVGVLGKGGPHEQRGEAILGWDTVNKTVYYLDCHGGSTVYKGTVKRDGEDLVFDFATIVGAPARWREVLRFPDQDTMQLTIFSEKEGKFVPVVEQTSKRRKSEVEKDQLVTEGVITAPIDAVWAAFTTKEGQESWNVAHAEIELKTGGKMRTHYNPMGHIGDPDTIENTILCFEPKCMLAIQVTKPPQKFPFKDAVKKMWTVIHLEDIGPACTRLRIVGTGYDDDDESGKLREFFNRGNAYTLRKLQEKFANKNKTAPSEG
jgi:uncharacterized protein YndB with AHSA1/START domain